MNLEKIDNEIYKLIGLEKQRQQNNIELIASENFVSNAVLEAQGSVLTNKYAEGYSGKRYYGGCENVDGVETLAIERLKKLFGCSYANVQAHSGSQANMAVYRSLLKTGDVVLGMALDHGGHLTHGHHLNFSGIDYKFIPYYLSDESEVIDYNQVLLLAKKYKPKMIVTGASAYSRSIDFKKFKEIASEVGAYLFVDMAHIAGLVAGGVHQNPVPYADVVSSTTHKTLRGPRGGIILTNNPEIAKKIDSTIFPGTQGGPLMHVIAAKAVSFYEALQPEFKDYAKSVVENAKAMSQEFIKLGYVVVSGGTDNHLFIVNIRKSVGITGKVAQEVLDSVGITCNKNTVPYDTEKPFITSGIRIGTPSITTRGFSKDDCIKVVHLIDKALKNISNGEVLAQVKAQVHELTGRYPLPY